MKKNLIILSNVLIVLAIVAFVVLYAGHAQQQLVASKTEAFENMTVAMENITTNYLIGEQRVCESWANYINAGSLTGEEAVAFLRDSVATPGVMAHILYTDGDPLTGLSTEASPLHPDDFTVSYAGISLFRRKPDAFLTSQASVHATRAYTNPISAVQSIAFCSAITLRDAASGAARPAMLMRVVPVSAFHEKWVFPTEDYKTAEISLIDAEGDYILKGRSFKNSNFFEFYLSYNETSAAGQEAMKRAMLDGSGSLTLTNSRGEKCLVAHTRVLSTDGWIFVTMIPMDDLGQAQLDWVLIGIVSAGLLLLLVLDIIFMLRFNRRFKLMAEQAEQASRAKTDFLSTMSHDIRTPMNAIIGLTAIADKNIGDTATVKDSLHKISLASNHLLTLINDILDISKVESGKLTLSPLTFSIVETAENLVNISQPMIKEKNIDFSFRINRMEKEYLYADQLRLNQIYINILSNAIKYTQPGGRVSVDLREEESSVPGCVKLCYTVADNGIGMTPAFMEKMYQPFSRQTDSRVNSIQGTGLGLAITKKMVDLMGGTIDCESAPGKGTTFTIKIDIPVADRQREDLKLDELDVLIVDDDPILLQTTSETLESMGVHADCADNGAQALDMIAQRHEQGRDYGIVIVDWRMPGMDGVETVRSIRRDINPDIPILLISAYDWSDIEDSARGAGANGFISKPLFRSKLYAKINELLGTEAKSIEPEDDYTDLAGLNILVAEDNDINWEIISAMLGMYGITTERAENGRVCVDKMEAADEGQYMLIFMDIQMPVMNGLDATRAIRRLPRPWASSIPIIAMTADAFSENVAACMEAGMNGHIAKPIDIKLVIKEIRRIKEETALAASARR